MSLHPGTELEQIAARLAGRDALAVILVELEGLVRIERRYGGAAHRGAVEALASLVRELCEEVVPPDDLLVVQERHGDSILAFLFRPRSDVDFYDAKLHGLSQLISTELRHQAKRLLYPYHRDAPPLHVGVAILLQTPGIAPERQVLQSIECARRDARIEAGIRAREDSRRLLHVILTGGLGVRFEPIADLIDAQVIGYEALARGPKGTDLYTPRQLFGLAEEAGLLFELDCLCRKLALESSVSLPEGRKIFLNCLPTAIGDPNLRDDGLRKILEDFNLNPSDLVLEISESESIDNFSVFREMRDSCQELGIQIAIDDAGTGYSSLEAIMEIAPDFIKTDRGLIRNIDADPSRREVVRALNAVAAGIGAKVIAEGVENDDEFRTLRELGIPYGQGYYFGEALSTDQDDSSQP